MSMYIRTYAEIVTISTRIALPFSQPISKKKIVNLFFQPLLSISSYHSIKNIPIPWLPYRTGFHNLLHTILPSAYQELSNQFQCLYLAYYFSPLFIFLCVSFLFPFLYFCISLSNCILLFNYVFLYLFISCSLLYAGHSSHIFEGDKTMKKDLAATPFDLV